MSPKRPAEDRFPPIGSYGFLSDCHTSALVSYDGSVEWLCLPRFDSPSAFAALLDRDAGHFKLGKLILCYDDNHITIDGTTSISFDSESHLARFAAEGWHVQRVDDSEDVEALTHAIQTAREHEEKPSFISIRSHIAYPAPNAVDTAKSHGAALGEDERMAGVRWRP